jgi:hypothetical protein
MVVNVAASVVASLLTAVLGAPGGAAMGERALQAVSVSPTCAANVLTIANHLYIGVLFYGRSLLKKLFGSLGQVILSGLYSGEVERTGFQERGNWLIMRSSLARISLGSGWRPV